MPFQKQRIDRDGKARHQSKDRPSKPNSNLTVPNKQIQALGTNNDVMLKNLSKKVLSYDISFSKDYIKY